MSAGFDVDLLHCADIQTPLRLSEIDNLLVHVQNTASCAQKNCVIAARKPPSSRLADIQHDYSTSELHGERKCGVFLGCGVRSESVGGKPEHGDRV